MQVTGLGVSGLTAGQDYTAKTLGRTERELKKILERLSTGQRINRASDDAAGLGVSEQLRTQVRGFKMASQNVTDAQSALRIAEGTANEVSSMVQRQRELAIQASSDTLTDSQRGSLDTEYQQLTQEIDRLSGSSQFNSQPVASNKGLASGDAQIQVGPNAGDQVALPQNDMSTAALGTAGSGIGTRESAVGAVSTLDTALNRLNTQRARIGAMDNRFDSTQNNLGIAAVNTQAAESVLRDQDMAKGVSELVRAQLLHQSGNKAFSRFNEISQNHMKGLLQGLF